MNIKNKLFARVSFCLLTMFALSGCGSGSSESGGSVNSVFIPLTFTGTYDTVVFRGDISIRLISPDRAAISLTGVRCLQSEFTVEYTTRPSEYSISELIPNQPDNPNSLGPPTIVMLWPTNGGMGTLILDAGSDCAPSEGTTSLTRS